MTGVESWWAAAVEAIESGRPQYGTSMHFPDCLGGGCTGCLPEVVPGAMWDGAVVVDGVDVVARRMWLNGLTTADRSEWLLAVDPAADDPDRAVVFARVRDGAIRVHIPDVR